jgi:L,D-peptidoglycan transpeptidase YkuD (ErfK/YbiS/YcfS/YnhG family)
VTRPKSRPKSRNLGRLIFGTSSIAVLTAGCAGALPPASPASLSSPAPVPLGPRPDNRLVPHTAAAADPVPSWARPLLAHDVPAGSGQAVIVRSPSMSSTTNTMSLWIRTAAGWRQTGTLMAGHDGERGWSAYRKAGDRQTPTGVYSLTAAGGRLPSPGTREQYEHSSSYFHTAGHFLGHNTFGVFDYVVAIDFNRVAGSPVSSTAQPWGPGPGGDIWLHVDNGAPTLGCVTVAEQNMVMILRWLNPAQHPVIVLKAG